MLFGNFDFHKAPIVEGHGLDGGLTIGCKDAGGTFTHCRAPTIGAREGATCGGCLADSGAGARTFVADIFGVMGVIDVKGAAIYRNTLNASDEVVCVDLARAFKDGIGRWDAADVEGVFVEI